MNKKAVLGTIFGIGSTIAVSLLLRNGNVDKTMEMASEIPVEPEKLFGGIPLSILNAIAKEIDPRNYCTIDQWGFLVLHYKSNRGHQNFTTQLDLDDALKLFDLKCGPVFPGQKWSRADEFVDRVNEAIQFVSARK